MALDPRIALQVTPVNVNRTFSDILTNVGNIDALQRQREAAPFQQQILEQQAQAAQQQGLDSRTKSRLTSLVGFAQDVLPDLRSDNPQGALEKAQSRLSRMQQTIADNPGIQLDTTETEEFIQMLQTPEGQLRATELAEQALQVGQQQGLLGGPQETAGTREFNSLLKVAQDPNSTPLEIASARRKLGDLERVNISAQERIAADPTITEQVAQSQAEIIGAKEGRKLESQLKFKPEITKAVKLAEKEAAERGKTLTALNRSKAALPGLTKAVGQLRDLAKIGTSTFGGKIFDAAVRETGFGSTKGATARAKFVAIVNNQVLPLLKETFGAAFTFQEGEALKATMGDPDATPEEKMVQLDAFIEQKRRDIETRELQLESTQTQPTATATGPNGEKLGLVNGQWVRI